MIHQEGVLESLQKMDQLQYHGCEYRMQDQQIRGIIHANHLMRTQPTLQFMY